MACKLHLLLCASLYLCGCSLFVAALLMPCFANQGQSITQQTVTSCQCCCRYAAAACDVTFEQGNAFILPHHEGKFDRVHVGGLCDLAKLPALIKLLKPEKGRIVVPCGPELLAVTIEHGKVRIVGVQLCSQCSFAGSMQRCLRRKSNSTSDDLFCSAGWTCFFVVSSVFCNTSSSWLCAAVRSCWLVLASFLWVPVLFSRRRSTGVCWSFCVHWYILGRLVLLMCRGVLTLSAVFVFMHDKCVWQACAFQQSPLCALKFASAQITGLQTLQQV